MLGILFTHDFARVILLAKFKNFVFQPDNLFFTLFRINWSSWSLIFPWVIGNPRYLPNLVAGWNPITWLIDCLVSF